MIQWFKKHPEFLRKESTALSNDSNYKELYQFRNLLFISHGNIIVRLDKVHRFPILIIYSDATPYRIPLVFPLERVFSNENIEHFAGLTIDEAIKEIYPNIRFYYDLRHQNNSGVLCILESENLDTGSNYFSITTILERVREWCSGHITNMYPLDSEEVDFSSHFNFVNKEIKLVYPEQFFNNHLIEGDCYATLFKIIPKSKYCTSTKIVYYGAFLDGVARNGLFEQVDLKLIFPLPHEKLKTSLDLYTNPSIVNQLIVDEILLKAQWFHIDREPSPFHSFKQLIEIIGNGHYENGIKRISARCTDTFKIPPKSFLLGLRFPNRRKIDEFQLFKIHEIANPPILVIDANPLVRMSNILERYEKVEVIEGEKITETSFHQRNSNRANYEILKMASVNILGVGAIGSEIADCVAKAGIGKISLCDNQTLKAHNPVRHLAGLNHLGEYKVNAVADILFNHNPFINIWVNQIDLYNLDINQHFMDYSISISSVADDNVEGFVNQQLVLANRIAFYVRALRGGKTARIFRVIPGKDACFNCLTLYRNEKSKFVEIPDDLAYPTLKNECNNPIRPASASDLKLIASIASRILIDFLQEKETAENHWIWASESLPNTPIQEPFSIYSQYFPPHSNCVYCHQDRPLGVFIQNDQLIIMQDLITNNPKIETGGVLAGWTKEDGNIFISDASGPGPKAIQTTTKFEKDVEYCQNFLDDLFIQSEKRKVYLGEWHSHPSSDNNPSGTDLGSLSEISMQKEYLTVIPIMIIFSNNGTPSCTVHPAGKRYYATTLDQVK